MTAAESDQVVDPAELPAWRLLAELASGQALPSIAALLDGDADRFAAFSLRLNELLVDFSRSSADAVVVEGLLQLASERNLAGSIEAMFAGALVNPTERRAALHTALRGSAADAVIGDRVAAEARSFLAFADAVRAGDRQGSTGKPFRWVINIGIGGSDLGPRLIADALAKDDEPVAVRFVAGIDGMELAEALRGVDPAATLFIVCSKTFTTLETRLNANAARDWLKHQLGGADVAAHFAAISVNHEAMDEFGIAADARFQIWDWVGGRYSLWSAIGLSAAIAIGSDRFQQLLDGAASMDAHFATAPMARNIPVMLGLLAIWNQVFLGVRSHVILPYDQRLELLPAYLQQLFMESLGKHVRINGQALVYPTGVPVWGGVGSVSQHSFAQLLHQGTASVEVDYIGTVRGPELEFPGGHLDGLANLVAQAEALARGQSYAAASAALAAAGEDPDEIGRLSPHKVHPGDRPSNIILLRSLSPFNLGMLLAMYEQEVFVQAAILDINPFDQWGVELGKLRAGRFARYLRDGDMDALPAIGNVVLGWISEE